MIELENNWIINNFFDEIGLELRPDHEVALKNFVVGLIVNEKGTINNIAENTVASMSERQLNRSICGLSEYSTEILKNIILIIQEEPKLSMKSTGVGIIDEHIMKKTGQKIEGVDYFYSSTEDKVVLGLSMISTHYYDNNIQYPISHNIYRKKEELQKYGKESKYRSKNEIARYLIRNFHNLGGPTDKFVIDSYFFTKENIKELQRLNYSYVSVIKKNWTCTYEKTHYSITELQESIPESDYNVVEISNPKTKNTKYYKVAKRDVFIRKIGNHCLLFTKILEHGKNGNLVEKYPGKWKCLVSDMRSEAPEELMKLYMKRWPIETSYRDENQNLKLHGCMWRNIEGQNCYIALVFIAYIFLCWAKINGYLDSYNTSLDTIGSLCSAFKRFNDENFGEWISQLKHNCRTCNIANFIYSLVYGKKVDKIYILT